jgi:hypothetical protein
LNEEKDMSKDEIFRAALSLPEDARAELAHRLVESLDDADQEVLDQDEWDRLWAREAEDRIAAYDRGELAEIPAEEVFASLKFRDKE